MRERIAVVVDDEPCICELIEDALAEHQITIWKCSSAEEALERAANFVVDVFVIDVFMPGKGGLWLIEELRTHHPESKIIAMSGGYQNMTPEKTLRALEKLDVKYRLKKPFSIDCVVAFVDGVLGNEITVASKQLKMRD